MTEGREEKQDKVAAVARLAESAIRGNIEAAFERRAEIGKMDFSEIEKLSKIIGAGVVASNFCCNGF